MTDGPRAGFLIPPDGNGIQCGQEIALAPLVVDEITLVGSRCGPFEPALRLLEQRLVEVESLLDAEYPLERGIEAFTHAATPGTLKVQVVME